MEKTWEQRRKRLYEVVEIGAAEDAVSRGYDFFSTFLVLINLAVSIAYTYESLRLRYGPQMETVEMVTAVFFTVDYALRLWTARFLRPELTEGRALWSYMTSFTGLVDLLSFLPYYLPALFPAGMVAFRMFRVIRIFRLFRINAYYDSLHVITEVITGKRQQLLSSVFIILVLMLASSLCMYSLEHDAQPEVFANAFSGIWWSVSTLLTVGYGDIYPITTLGKLFGIFISFLGVGIVAIPTGIISAGFVDQYSRIKQLSEYAREEDLLFIKARLTEGDSWAGKTVQELKLPAGVIVAVIQRGEGVVVPRGDVRLQARDTLVLGAEAVGDQQHIDLKEITLGRQNPWNGRYIRDLDISRKTIIVMVKRNGRVLVPRGDLALLEGDRVVLYTQMHLADAERIRL
jgi:voltage-gated potassium channel